MDFLKRTLPYLLLVFLLTVLVRLPQLNRPMSKHHEFAHATTVRILQVWWDEGIQHFNCNPATNYKGKVNKFINNHANVSGKVFDENGNYYYVSHPPFAYYVPYAVFSLLNVRPDVLPLQVFNLFLHFISALFIYFIVCLLSFQRARSVLHFPSFMAFTFYMFLPATLWFQGNVYMSDMAVHTLFVIGVYVVLKMIIRNSFYSPKYIFFYVLVLSMMIYTSWLGVFFGLGVMVYSLLHLQKQKAHWLLIGITIFVTASILRLVLWQYSGINGMETYLSEMINRYVERGSLSEVRQSALGFVFSYFIWFKNILYNYLANYFFIYILLGAFVWIALTKKKLKMVFSENGFRFAWLSVTPVVLLHLVFLNYSAQDFTTLYASLFYAVAFGIFYDKIKKAKLYEAEKLNRYAIILIVCNLALYQVINKPGKTSIFGGEYDMEQKAGEFLKRTTKENEVIFVVGETPSIPILVYAQRNVQKVATKDEAINFMKKNKINEGRIFEMENGIIAGGEVLDFCKGLVY